jgi:hypothetical protein
VSFLFQPPQEPPEVQEGRGHSESGTDQRRGLSRPERPPDPFPDEVARDDRDGKENADRRSLGGENVSARALFFSGPSDKPSESVILRTQRVLSF